MTDRENEALRRPLFYVLVLVAVYLSFLILGPFLVPLAWAAVLAMTFHRLHVLLAVRIGPNRAALVTTLVAALLIVAPAVTLVTILAHEVPQVATYVQEASISAPRQLERVWGFARERSPFAIPEDPTLVVREAVERVLAFLAPRVGAVVANVFATLGSLFAMLFAMFFLLRDGDDFGRQLRSLLPLPPAECDRLLRDTRDLVIASVGAGLLVAAIQGLIGGVAFGLVGIGAPVFWGLMIAFCSLIPVVGAALVWVPAALWLLLSGHIGGGIVLVLVGVLGISLVDNILRPLLLSGNTSVSGLVIFFGLLGGVAAFGFIGLVIGPIVLVTTGNLLRLFAKPDLIEGPP